MIKMCFITIAQNIFRQLTNTFKNQYFDMQIKKMFV